MQAFPTEEFSLDDYRDLRNSLITDALEKGRGYGGSVRRVITVAEPVIPPGADSDQPPSKQLK